MIEKVKCKIIISGDHVEIFEYEEGYLKGYSDKFGSSGRKKGEESENYNDNRGKVIARAKKRLMRLINSNIGRYGDRCTAKFLTLTFGENITDLDHANYEFKKFKQRLNYEVYGKQCSDLKYTVVIEFQERGAIHYHMIIYNMPYVKQKKLQETWDNGHVWINKIEEIDNVGLYISSYLGDPVKDQGKDQGDSRLKDRKSYFNSRGLYEPVEITDKKIVEAIKQSLLSQEKSYSYEYENEYLGKVRFAQYLCK